MKQGAFELAGFGLGGHFLAEDLLRAKVKYSSVVQLISTPPLLSTLMVLLELPDEAGQ